MKSKTFVINDLDWRPLSVADVSMIHGAIRGNVAEYFFDFKTEAETKVWIVDAVEKHKMGHKQEFVVFDQDEFIGLISPNFEPGDIAEVGMWLVPEKQGQGYGKRVLGGLLQLLEARNIREVLYQADKNNLPSIKLAKSLGFTVVKSGDEMEFSKKLGLIN